MTEMQFSHYERLGGESGVRRLVDRFYDLMERCPEAEGIRKMHPQSLSGSRDKLFMFLSGWLGGPALYIENFGHPRLRARHLPFVIGEAERDAWMFCMSQALDEIAAEMALDTMLRDHLKQSLWKTADHMRNQQP